jgi:uncharacterized integral membrane protein
MTVDIPGWVLVAVAGLSILLSGVAVGSPVTARTRMVFGWTAAVGGALLVLLAILAAVGT